MVGDFQQLYQHAERAYGQGNYTEARRLASGLLEQLMDQPQDPDAQAAVLGWRAFVALLLGHIELYGRETPQQAFGYYEQGLATPTTPWRDWSSRGWNAVGKAVRQSHPAGTNSCCISTTGPAAGSVSEGSTGDVKRTQRRSNSRFECNSHALAGVDIFRTNASSRAIATTHT